MFFFFTSVFRYLTTKSVFLLHFLLGFLKIVFICCKITSSVLCSCVLEREGILLLSTFFFLCFRHLFHMFLNYYYLYVSSTFVCLLLQFFVCFFYVCVFVVAKVHVSKFDQIEWPTSDFSFSRNQPSFFLQQKSKLSRFKIKLLNFFWKPTTQLSCFKSKSLWASLKISNYYFTGKKATRPTQDKQFLHRIVCSKFKF